MWDELEHLFLEFLFSIMTCSGVYMCRVTQRYMQRLQGPQTSPVVSLYPSSLNHQAMTDNLQLGQY